MALIIREINWQDTLSVRHHVLWPDRPVSFSRVDGDENATHFGAFSDGKLVCVASIYLSEDSARLRKFVTLPDYQGRGIGSKVLAKAIEQLKQQKSDTSGVTQGRRQRHSIRSSDCQWKAGSLLNQG